jgi:hypothetical protein
MIPPERDVDQAAVTTLRRERDEAVARVRVLEHELGRLRGQVVLMQATSLWRSTWRRAAKGLAYRTSRLLKRT